jgi:cystathionine beta-lyase/cystathionine gamma-synthase
MTRLALSEDSGKEFAIRGYNTATNEPDDAVVFYDDVTKVHVVPERESFTIQVLTPELEVEMDFADAEAVDDALEKFEARKVLEVFFEVPKSVRITPLPVQD